MKNLILLSLIILFVFSSCEKPEPQIADNSEIPVKVYHEQIYVQPIIVDEQIVSIVNNGTSTYLKSYDNNGSLNWEQNIDLYILTGQTYTQVPHIKISLNELEQIVLQIDDWGTFKIIKFDKQGNLINQFENFVHQPDTIFFENSLSLPDTITNTNDSIPDFYLNNVFSLSDGNTLVLSYEKSELMDSTIFQFTLYNNSGDLIEHSYSFFAKQHNNDYEINHNFVDKNDNLLMIIELRFSNPVLFKVNLNTGSQSVKEIPFKFLNIFTFFEDSKNNYIFTGEIYNNSSSSISGLLFSIDPSNNILWEKMYQGNLASIILSVCEMNDGYLFTGFNTSTNFDENIDWRFSFEQERNANAIVLKTDFQGELLWQFSPQIQQEATFGAVTFFTANKTTFFGQRVNNNIINTMFMDIDTEHLTH